MNSHMQSANSQNSSEPEPLANGTYEIEWAIPYKNIDDDGAPSFLHLPGKITISSCANVQGEAITAPNCVAAISRMRHLPGAISDEHLGFASYPETIPLVRGCVKDTQKEILLPDAEIYCMPNRLFIKADNGFVSLSPIPDWKENVYDDALPLVNNFSLSLEGVEYAAAHQAAPLSTTFSMNTECSMNELMERCISPIQIICSSLSRMLKHINHVESSLVLQPEKPQLFQVVGEAIRNAPNPNEEYERPKVIDADVLRSLLVKWQDNMGEPVIRAYGTFCLEQSGLARFKFLLSIETLEAEYDSMHRNEINAERQKSQRKTEELLKKLHELFMKDDAHILNSSDKKSIKCAVKNSQRYTTLTCKLRILCSTKPWIKERLAENQTVKEIIKERNQKGYDVFDSLATIRNWLSHGDREDMGNGFPDLANIVESWCRAILFEVLDAPEEIVQQVSDFYGWKPAK